jgi:hypothetical protein
MFSPQVDGAGWPPGVVTTADRERFAAYADALRFYQGAQWRDRPRRGETRLTLNYARSLVRKVAAYVFPAPATFAVRDGTEGEDASRRANRAERILAETITHLDLARLDIELCVDGAVVGDAAVKVTWDAGAAGPVVAPVDPATLVVEWLPDNPRRVLTVTQVYGLSGSGVRALFGAVLSGIEGALPNRAYPVVERWTAEHWRVEIAGQVVRDQANPYGAIPYVIVPNNPRPHAFWGESDLIDLIDVCRELNARMSGLSHVLAVSGAPITVLENVDGSEGISVGPGAKWELPEGARAYLLDLLGGGGVGLHVQYVDLLYRALHDLSETPRTAFGDAGRDLSGAALEVEVQPLIQKVQRKRRVWDAFYRQRNALLLEYLERFGGVELGGLRQTETIWPSILPSDIDGAVRNAAQLVAGGIHSRRTAVAALGGADPEGEFARVLAELEALGGDAGAAGEGIVSTS